MYTKELHIMYTKYPQCLNYFVYITDLMDAYHCKQNKKIFLHNGLHLHTGYVYITEIVYKYIHYVHYYVHNKYNLNILQKRPTEPPET